MKSEERGRNKFPNHSELSLSRSVHQAMISTGMNPMSPHWSPPHALFSLTAKNLSKEIKSVRNIVLPLYSKQKKGPSVEKNIIRPSYIVRTNL